MNLFKIVEYGIYHDNLDKKISLPGIKNGHPQLSFFKKKPILKIEDFEGYTSDIISKTLKNINNINLLCSGGVDSSILLYFLKKYKKKFLCIHNFYPNHNLNDLKKIETLRKFFVFQSKKVLISSENYMKGMKIAYKNNYFGNTYSPTLYYSINFNKKNNNKILMTGSGPDEFFYGMEKYNLKYFKRLSNLKTNVALEKLDTNYNESFYEKILNPLGRTILKEVKNRRRLLYKEISKINKNIFEAQRILSYCTVSNQHFEMFEKLSRNFDLKHVSPFFNEDYIKFAFSHKLFNYLDFKEKNKDANMGKKQLKQMLTKYTSHKHAYDKKIGFHAPISKMIETKVNLKNFEVKLKYEKLEKLIDIDKLKKNLKINLFLKKKNYNLYSILNIQEMIN